MMKELKYNSGLINIALEVSSDDIRQLEKRNLYNSRIRLLKLYNILLPHIDINLIM